MGVPVGKNRLTVLEGGTGPVAAKNMRFRLLETRDEALRAKLEMLAELREDFGNHYGEWVRQFSANWRESRDRMGSQAAGNIDSARDEVLRLEQLMSAFSGELESGEGRRLLSDLVHAHELMRFHLWYGLELAHSRMPNLETDPVSGNVSEERKEIASQFRALLEKMGRLSMPNDLQQGLELIRKGAELERKLIM